MAALILPIAALAANVFTQIVVFRIRRGAHYFRSIVEGFLAGLVVFAILQIALFLLHGFDVSSLLVTLLVDLPIYLALSYCAYSFIQLGQTSIRIRMYSEIASAPTGVNIEELRREYDDEALMQARIQRLVESGDLVLKGDCYVTGRTRLLAVANLIFAAKRLLLGRESEFDLRP